MDAEAGYQSFTLDFRPHSDDQYPRIRSLASVGPELWLLAGVIAFEYLGVGLGTAALTAFIARESSRTFAATQFALFTALTAFPRSLANASTGWLVEELGWVVFFVMCTGTCASWADIIALDCALAGATSAECEGLTS